MNLYCSPACLGAAKRGLEEITISPSEVQCLVCPKYFLSASKNRDQRFCSRSCSASVNNLGVSRTKTPRPRCVGCSSKAAQHSIYCSRICKREHKIRNWLAGEHMPPAITSICKTYRPYILKDQGGKCAICPVATIWEGASLVLVLDHIDGNSENNSRGNLRLVCPNCDSQLPTYKSKNRGSGRYFRRKRYAEGKSF